MLRLVATASSRSSQFASGSQRKRASVSGVAYFLDVIQAPSRDFDGHIRVITRKCRFGWRKRDTVAADVLITNTASGGVCFNIQQPDDVSIKPKVFRPTHYMQRVSEYLQAATQTQSKTQIITGVGGKNKAVSAAIDQLVAEGYCSVAEGARKAKEITFIKAYEKETDNKTDEPF